jgi:hypothetical protein
MVAAFRRLKTVVVPTWSRLAVAVVAPVLSVVALVVMAELVVARAVLRVVPVRLNSCLVQPAVAVALVTQPRAELVVAVVLAVWPVQQVQLTLVVTLVVLVRLVLHP